MATTRSSATIAEANYFSSLYDTIHTLLKRHEAYYDVLKKNVKTLSSLISHDSTFLEPGKILGNLLQTISQIGTDTLSQITEFEALLPSLCCNEKNLKDDLTIVQPILIKKIDAIHDANKEQLALELTASFTKLAATHGSRIPNDNNSVISKAKELLKEIEGKIENASPSVKEKFNAIKQNLEAIEKTDASWQEVVLRIKKQEDILCWMRNKARLSSLTVASDEMVQMGIEMDTGVGKLFKASIKNARTASPLNEKRIDDAVTSLASNEKEKQSSSNNSILVTKVKSSRDSKQVNPTKRLYDIFLKKRASLERCQQDIAQARLVNDYGVQQIALLQEALTKTLLDQTFLEKQIANEKLSNVLKEKLRLLLDKVNKTVILQRAQLTQLQKITLCQSAKEELHNRELTLQKYLELFKVGSAYEQLFINVDTQISEFSQHKQTLTNFYSEAFVQIDLLQSADFGDTVKKHGAEFDNIPAVLTRLRTSFTSLSETVSEMWENILASKKEVASVNSMISALQCAEANTDAKKSAIVRLSKELLLKLQEKTVLSEAEQKQHDDFVQLLHKNIPDLLVTPFDGAELIVLRQDILAEETQFDLLTQKAVQAPATPSVSAEPAPIVKEGSSVSRVVEVPPKKLRRHRVIMKEQESDDEVVESIIETPKKKKHASVNQSTTHAVGSAYEIAKYFQQQLFSSPLSAKMGGDKVFVSQVEEVVGKGDVLQPTMAVLPHFAAEMSKVFNKALHGEKYTKLDAARQLMNNVNHGAKRVIANPSFFRQDKTQSFYHSTERDSFMLGRVLNTDLVHMKTLIDELHKLPTPKNIEALNKSTSSKALQSFINTVDPEKLDRTQLVTLYTKSASLFNKPTATKVECQFALHRMLLLCDIKIDEMLSNIKAQMTDYHRQRAWGFTIPTHVRQMEIILNEPSNDASDKVTQLASIMLIARKAASNNHFTRSKFTQAFYQQLGYGAEYFVPKQHYQLRYVEGQSILIPRPGEILCQQGGQSSKPWKVTYRPSVDLQTGIHNKALRTRSVDSAELKNTGFVGKTPLSQNDMIILGRIAELPLDIQELMPEVEKTAACNCFGK